jgi:UDP-N-acetylmuramoylalanine--D-glutamate ligase
VLLNLAPDHLDRHGSYEKYVGAKLRLFAHQTAEDLAVLPDDLEAASPGRARRVLFGRGSGAALRERDGKLVWGHLPLLDAREISLSGQHNRENAMAAAAVCLARGLNPHDVANGLRSFPGVPHRLELIAVRNGVSYVNDSKATNVDSALVALRTYDGGVHLIAGGRGKHQDFSPLGPLVSERCRAVYLIGEASRALAAALAATDVHVFELGDLEHALAAASRAARPGEIVLLSPACASYDQYRDFEARGDHFRTLVGAG